MHQATMQRVLLPVLAWLLTAAPSGAAGAMSGGDPIGKVLELMEGLSNKIKQDAAAEEKAFKEYVAWCDSTIRNTGFEIETASQQKDKLEALIGQLTSEIQVRSTKIEELAATVSSASADLEQATDIRKKEEADFLASEKELVKVIDTIQRASQILQRELQKNAGAFAQLDSASTQAMLDSLSVVVDAAAFSVNDRQALMALMQAQEDAMDGELGPPAAAAYKSKSGNIIDMLEDLKEKAQVQLGSLRKSESTAKHNYDKLKQSLDFQISTASRDLEAEKSGKASAEEGKAVAEGELKVATEQLKAAKEKLESTKAGCEQVSQDHDATVKSRNEELKVVQEAITVVRESTGGASFLQTSSATRLRSAARSADEPEQPDVAAMVRRLAQRHHSAALAQLSSRIAAILRFGSTAGADPFVKVRQLIQGLIEQLKREAENEATEKAYCDQEMAKTKAKKDELEDDLTKLTAKIDQSSAKSAELKGQVAQLQADLALIAKESAEMERIRKEAHADYVKTKADLEKGLTGVRKALSMLREYYSSGASLLQDDNKFTAFMQQPAAPEKHEKSTAGGGIIGFLEVIENDLAKNLAKEEAMESDAQSAYDKRVQENKLTVAAKEKDVQYKTQDAKGLDKSIAELSSDRDNVSAEQAAVLEYWAKLQERCVAKPETYEERAGRRQAEIAGLKEALASLNAALLQRPRRGNMRGAVLAPSGP